MVGSKRGLQCQEAYLNIHRRGHILLAFNIDFFFFFGPSAENVITYISANITTGVTVNSKSMPSLCLKLVLAFGIMTSLGNKLRRQSSRI